MGRGPSGTLPCQPGPRVKQRDTHSKMCSQDTLRLGRNHDLAVDDLRFEVLELRLDVVDLAAGCAVADAASLEVIDLGAGGELVLGQTLDEVERRAVDCLDHRGDDDVPDAGRGCQRLVGVDTDRHLARSLCGGEHAATRATSGGVDHVSTLLEHCLLYTSPSPRD